MSIRMNNSTTELRHCNSPVRVMCVGRPWVDRPGSWIAGSSNRHVSSLGLSELSLATSTVSEYGQLCRESCVSVAPVWVAPVPLSSNRHVGSLGLSELCLATSTVGRASETEVPLLMFWLFLTLEYVVVPLVELTRVRWAWACQNCVWQRLLWDVRVRLGAFRLHQSLSLALGKSQWAGPSLLF